VGEGARLWLSLLLVAAAPPSSSVADAAVQSELVVPCRNEGQECWPTAFDFTPDGDIYYVERFTGQIRVFDPSTRRDRFWKDIGPVGTGPEQGLLGIALDPDWPGAPWVYAYYTQPRPLENRIVKISVLADGSFQTELLVTIPAADFHNGGVIEFGPDGMLYAVTGDNAGDPAEAQDETSLLGKVLRMTKTGDIPPDNPFPGSHAFSYGHRNSFGLAFDPVTGKLWQTENGPECNDEINLVLRGQNYGWGHSADCPATNRDGPDIVPPRWVYGTAIAPTGAIFCDRCGLGPASEGALLFGSFGSFSGRVVDHALHGLSLNDDRTEVASEELLFGHTAPILAVEGSPGDDIYFSDPNGIYRLSVDEDAVPQRIEGVLGQRFVPGGRTGVGPDGLPRILVVGGAVGTLLLAAGGSFLLVRRRRAR
jgi:glucose/arabinose dehydrogenase